MGVLICKLFGHVWAGRSHSRKYVLCTRCGVDRG
ncbi:MAG: hypothetical protein EOO79_05315 [Oxalobacteraceae bacterium]|nr:MAG: hypothetical protein EOO79_05315 [Oxalobacteraceae bacterium]